MSSDKYYRDEITEIIQRFPYSIHREGPTKLLDFLYLGNYTDAIDLDTLKALGITHILNCAGSKRSTESPYAKHNCTINHYKQFEADDDIMYDMLQHFDEAKEFIDSAKDTGGRILVHCVMGRNRSGVICAAYLMEDQQMDLIETVRIVKQKRGIVLTNSGFQRQLISFARCRGLLPGHTVHKDKMCSFQYSGAFLDEIEST